MKEVTIENGGTPINDVNDPQCTHIVINDQVIKQLPNLGTSTTTTDQWNNSDIESSSNSVLIASGSVTPTSKSSNNPAALFINMNMSPFSNTRASIVRAEWFWASIQICCRASECLYEFTKPKSETGNVKACFSSHAQCYGVNVQAVNDSKCRFISVSVTAPGGSNVIAAFPKIALNMN